MHILQTQKGEGCVQWFARCTTAHAQKCWYTHAANYLISEPLDSQKYLLTLFIANYTDIGGQYQLFAKYFLCISCIQTAEQVQSHAVQLWEGLLYHYIDDDGSPLHII